jgi:drug/metabolite transporter (DMT)-like permease
MSTTKHHSLATIKYDLALVAVTFIWGTTFVIAKNAVTETSPINYLAARFTVAAVFLALLYLPYWRELTKSSFKGGIILGSLLYGGFFFQAWGLVYTTPAKAAFITGISVILVPFLSYLLLSFALTLEHLLAVVLATGGFALLTLPSTTTSINIGDVLALVGTLFWALHIVVTETWTRQVAAIPLLLLQLVTGAVLFNFSAIVLKMTNLLPTLTDHPIKFTLLSLSQIVYLAIIATIVTILVQTKVQHHISATRTAIIFSLEPAFAALVSYLVTGENLGWRAVVGGILIILAILCSSIKLFAKSQNPALKIHLSRESS